jgi:hypothetical protein
VAESSQPAGTTLLGAVPGAPPDVSASPSSGRSADLGAGHPRAVATEEPDGGNLHVRIR